MTTQVSPSQAAMAPLFSPPPSSRSHPIDLTLDDLDRPPAPPRPPIANHPSANPSSPASASFSTMVPPLYAPPQGPVPAPSSSFSQSLSPSRAPALSPASQPMYSPQFHGPSNSAAFFPSTVHGLPASNPLVSLHSQTSPPPYSPSNSSARQIIDLTSSPSPPPGAHTNQRHMGLPQALQQHPSMDAKQIPDVPHKAPVCIGQLTVTALVLYPITYLQQRPSLNPQQPNSDWAMVKLHSDPVKNGINIKTPLLKGMAGEVTGGEVFGVVEDKSASILGPLLSKGHIRMESMVRRGLPNMPIIPLRLLVHTPNGNIPFVSNLLQKAGLLLDHPSSIFNLAHVPNVLYLNPHNPPPGGHVSNQIGRPNNLNPGSSRWSAPAVAGRSVEIQRSQADEVFKCLRSSEELEETGPSSDIATHLYPHQKKALTFLLEREREIFGPDGRSSTLWQMRTNPQTRSRSWVNIVTQRELFEEPEECKGALLADDMGLGKTITCISLIAATLHAARTFAEQPLPPLVPPVTPNMRDLSLRTANFAGAVWGMPDAVNLSEPPSGKAKAELAKHQQQLELDYIRTRRLKARSRGTLIVCPLSTVANWEEQIREHWAGDVTILGGSSCCPSTPTPTPGSSQGSASTPVDCTVSSNLKDATPLSGAGGVSRKAGSPLRMYVYHGNSRRPDPAFIANFDVVITTYSTLATEYSKQTRSLVSQEADDDDGEGSDSNFLNGTPEIDESNNHIIKLSTAKEKKGTKRKLASSLLCGALEAASPLQSIHWFRVVLDEAHTIKETSTVGSRASCDLAADRRLCLTGTPVQNRLEDVFALIKFLRLKPFDDKNVWQEFIGIPAKFGQPLGVARLQTIMKCITLRRTKESTTHDGKKILNLPPRKDELRTLTFDEEEQKIYDQFFNESRADFMELSDKNEVMKNYVGILQKILRLRQICDHFELVRDKGFKDSACNYDAMVAAIAKDGINAERAAVIYSLLRDSGTAVCNECNCDMAPPLEGTQGDSQTCETDAPPPAKRGRKTKATASRGSTRANSPSSPRVVISKCQHLFCVECFRQSVFPSWPDAYEVKPRPCPICSTSLAPQDAVELDHTSCVESLIKKKVVKKEKRQKGILVENFHPSTKVKALLADLIVTSRANRHSVNYDPSSIEVQMVDAEGNDVEDSIVKTVVFSQWTSMLDKVEDALEIVGIRYERLDGTMKREERTRAMDGLKNDPGCEVLLVSLKAGGVGLNLTAAQRVYLMDPYWNPAVENQAVDRIHRLGQTRPVTTIKFVIGGTIEERLLDVQKKKMELANMTLGQHLSKAQIQSRRLEELNLFFQQ